MSSGPKKQSLNELKNQLARALADYDNLRKRVEAERKDLEKILNLRFILKILPIIDNFESAQKHLQDQGLAIAIGELFTVLKDEGVEKFVTSQGVKFDEKIHEAVEAIGGGKKGTIAQSVLAGYKWEDGTIIRHEKVKVFK